MEWAKLGVQVASMMYKSQRDDELHEVRRERDVYKKEAQCLKSHLNDVKKYSNASAYRPKPATPNYKKDFNKGHPATSKRETTAHNQKQFTEKKIMEVVEGEIVEGLDKTIVPKTHNLLGSLDSWRVVLVQVMEKPITTLLPTSVVPQEEAIILILEAGVVVEGAEEGEVHFGIEEEK